MKTIRNFLNIPLRLIKVVVLSVILILVGVTGPLFWFFIDPLVWILTGKYTDFDERGNKIVEIANRITDKIDFNTQNK